MPKAKVPRFGWVRRAHHLFGTFVLGARRLVGLVVIQANRRLCHVAADRLVEARKHQTQAQPESIGLRGILGRGSYQGQAQRALQALRGQEVQYLALARRTRNNVAYWDSLVCTGQLELHPYVHHHDLALPPEQRWDHFFLDTCQTPVTIWEKNRAVDTLWLPTILVMRANYSMRTLRPSIRLPSSAPWTCHRDCRRRCTPAVRSMNWPIGTSSIPWASTDLLNLDLPFLKR